MAWLAHDRAREMCAQIMKEAFGGGGFQREARRQLDEHGAEFFAQARRLGGKLLGLNLHVE